MIVLERVLKLIIEKIMGYEGSYHVPQASFLW